MERTHPLDPAVPPSLSLPLKGGGYANRWNPCTVTQLDDADLRRYGYSPTTGTPPFSTRADLRPWRNKRTGQVHQIPRGIDPGWEHNVGKIRVAQGIVNDVPGAAAIAAAPRDTNGFILAGRLARERGARDLAANLSGDPALANAVRSDIDGIFPRSWIEAANRTPVIVARAGVERGEYRQPGDAARLFVRAPLDGPYVGYWQGGRVHEYVHHLQYAMPGLDRLFLDLHHRRTKGEPLVVVSPGHPNETGRQDRYILPYQGREYGPDSDPREVMTMAYQYIWQRDLWDPGDGGWWKGRKGLLTYDPEMLDLALGALFKYDP